MRVLHVVQFAYPWEVRVGKINRSLQSVGSQVTVLARACGSPVEREKLADCDVIRVGVGRPAALSLPLPGNPYWRRAIERAAEETKPDLIIVREIALAGAAIKAARRRGVPIVLDMAEHYPEAMRSWKKYYDNPVLRFLVHTARVPDKIEARAVKAVDGILVVCEEQRQRLIEEYGFPADKICLALNTPELEAWRKFPKGSKRAEPVCFGYHGILCEDRELEVVLRGFEIAAAKDPKITLLIAGGGESEEGLRALAANLKSRERIRFTGRYKPETLGDLYAEADFGVVSLRKNRFTEHTLANKFFDYAALGKPFIFPDIKPLQRVMESMKCGLEFRAGEPASVAEAMLALRRGNYAELGTSGATSVEREFNWSVDEKRLLRFLGQFQRKGA